MKSLKNKFISMGIIITGAALSGIFLWSRLDHWREKNYCISGAYKNYLNLWDGTRLIEIDSSLYEITSSVQPDTLKKDLRYKFTVERASWISRDKIIKVEPNNTK